MKRRIYANGYEQYLARLRLDPLARHHLTPGPIAITGFFADFLAPVLAIPAELISRPEGSATQ
jgi:hypothetical protein